MEQIRRFFQEGALVLAALLRPAARSLRENSGLAALSVVLAFGLWIFVSNAENPTVTRVLPIDLQVQPANVPSDVAVANDLAKVSVSIRVSEVVFESLTAADFEATVDLDGLAVGDYDLPVEVRPLPSRGGLRIEEVLPAKIKVNLALLISKSVPLVLNVEGSPPSGFTMGAPHVEAATALVAGPREKIDLVAQVVASLDVTGRTESVDQAVRLQARDENGNLVQGVTLNPATANVAFDIRQTTFSRPLVVAPELIGTPAAGYNVVGVSVSPVAVTVSGPKEFIDKAETIKTKPINLDGKDQDVVKSISLELPEGAGVSVVGGGSVTVTVKIAPREGEVTLGIPVTATGLGDRLSIAGALPTVQVTLRGPLPVLLDLGIQDVIASIDLSGQDEGTHKLRVKATAADGVLVDAVAPEEVPVTLEKR